MSRRRRSAGGDGRQVRDRVRCIFACRCSAAGTRRGGHRRARFRCVTETPPVRRRGRNARGRSPFRPGAGGVPESSGGSGDVGGSTDSTAGLIGGAIERAAREKVDALAAELEKAARERIATVAEELEAVARTKAEALAAEVEKAARTEIDELSLAVAMSATALIGGVEQEAAAKLETAVDGLKRRAGAALAAVGVWGQKQHTAYYPAIVCAFHFIHLHQLKVLYN